MQHVSQQNFKTPQLQFSFTLPGHPTKEEIQEYLSYDPTSGILVNKKDRGRAKAGKLSGCIEKSRAGKLYRRVSFKGKRFYAHVLIMVLLGISVPAGLEIDHIDGDGLNNSISNLRVVTHSENMKNRKPKAK